jgi:quercetin dioxygenase-like cupin family protein
MQSDPQAIFRRREEGPAHEILGMRHVYKALASETGGHFMTFVLEVPDGCGAPMHKHDRDAECFYVLEGELTFIKPGVEITAGPGEFIYLPAGDEHAFCNKSGKPAKTLIVQSPGTEAEQFFFEMEVEGAKPGFDPAAVVPAVGARHGVRISPMPVDEAA